MINQFYFAKIGYAMTAVFKLLITKFQFCLQSNGDVKDYLNGNLCYKRQAYNRLMEKTLFSLGEAKVLKHVSKTLANHYDNHRLC